MPCFGDPWNLGLVSGTPEYNEEAKEHQSRLDKLLHVVDYYCELNEKNFPDNFWTGQLSSSDRQLLLSIYHHLKCDGIKVSHLDDIVTLINDDPTCSTDTLSIAQSCLMLLRMRGNLR